MALKTNEAYKRNGGYSYPSDNINPELKKNKDWFLAMAEAFWSDYVGGRCAWNYFGDETGTRTIEELRAYGSGRQNMDKIKGYLYKKQNPNDPNSRYVTKSNISYQGYAYMPKMVDIMRSFNSKIDYEINATAIDDDSLNDKLSEREAVKHYLNPNVSKTLKDIGYKPKMVVDPDEVGAQSPADIDFLIDSGGLTTQVEMAAQVVFNKTKKESYFHVIQDMCFDNLIHIGKGGLQEYIDKTTLTPKLREIDPMYAIVPRSRYADFRDRTRAGVIRFMNIAQLREESDLSEAELMQLAKDYSYMNPGYASIMSGGGYFNQAMRQNYMTDYGVDPMNDVQVLVLDFQFLSMDIDTYLKGNRRDGISEFGKVPFDYEISTKEINRGYRVQKSGVIKKYEAKWIIGSNHFLNYGPCSYVKYKGDKGNRTPVLDFHFAQTLNSSIVERCVSHIDDMNLALFKRRAAIATLPPAPRMIIEQGLLDNVTLNNTLQQPEDLIKYFEEKGIMIVNRVDEFGKSVNPNGKTIEFVPSGIIEDITMFTQEIEQAKEAIKEVTGVNDIVAAQTPEQRTGLGVSQLAAKSSDNALFNTFNTFRYMFEPAAEGIIGKWQQVCKDNEKQLEYVPLGSTTTHTMTIGKEFSRIMYSLKCEMVIGEDEKQMLLQEISQLKDSRRQNGGAGGITGAQYLKLHELIMSGNRKLAMFVMAQIEKSQQERDLAITRESQAATFQGQQQSAIVTEGAKQKTYMVEGSVKSKSTLIAEAAKRKTDLVIIKFTPAVPGTAVNPDIDQAIAECDNEIMMLMQAAEAEMNPPQQQGGPQQGQPDQGQQQLQQAS